jgi:hypothetical protein
MALAGSLLKSCGSQMSSPSLFLAYSAPSVRTPVWARVKVTVVLPLYTGKKTERSGSWLTSRFSSCPEKEEISAKPEGKQDTTEMELAEFSLGDDRAG